MFTTVAFRNSKVIHLAADGTKTLCGSETYRTAGSCVTKTRKAAKVTGEATCKRCIKSAAAAAPAPAPVEVPEVRELITFNVGTRRTRSTSARHPLEINYHGVSGLGV